MKAVPDGSIDLLFNIGSDKVTTYISGTVFGVRGDFFDFILGKCYLGEDLEAVQ